MGEASWLLAGSADVASDDREVLTARLRTPKNNRQVLFLDVTALIWMDGGS